MLYTVNENEKYIRIRIINLGVVASGITLESLLFNDMQTYNITQEDDISESQLKYFYDDSHIVFLVADLADDFVTENILEITNILYRHEKLFTGILANADTSKVDINLILEDLRKKSSLLIIEKEEDVGINSKLSLCQTLKMTINELLEIIDQEIIVFTAFDQDSSSLINLRSFFSQKGELYLYMNYNVPRMIHNIEQNDERLSVILEKSSGIWLMYSYYKEDTNYYSKMADFMEFLECRMDEDANFYFTIKEQDMGSIDDEKVSILFLLSN